MRVDRLQNVVRALRERSPEQFSMDRIVHPCGTPACALGTYVSREDLQSDFRLSGYIDLSNHFEVVPPWAGIICNASDEYIGYSDQEVLDHFGLVDEDIDELFSEHGCRRAETPEAAALYIEFFIARRQAQQVALQEVVQISEEIGLYDLKAS